MTPDDIKTVRTAETLGRTRPLIRLAMAEYDRTRPLIDGLTRAEMLRDPLSRRGLEGYIFQTGQPPEVRDAFLAAMGFNGTEFAPPDDLFDPLAPAPR